MAKYCVAGGDRIAFNIEDGVICLKAVPIDLEYCRALHGTLS